MSPKPVFVCFGDSCIPIESALPETIAAVGRRFRLTHAPAPSATMLNPFSFDHVAGRHRLRGERVEMSDSNLARVIERFVPEVSAALIRAHPELLWFHAGAAVHDGDAALFAGSWGRGKSTLVTELVKGGWEYLGDDVIALDPECYALLPFPRLPTVRSTSGIELPRERVSELSKYEVPLDPCAFPDRPVPLASIVFPRFRFGGANNLELMAPADAVVELLRHCVNFSDHRGDAVRHACHILSRLHAFGLDFCDPYTAAKLTASLHDNRDRRTPIVDPRAEPTA